MELQEDSSGDDAEMEQFLVQEKMKPKRALGYRRKLEVMNNKTSRYQFRSPDCSANADVDSMEKEFGEMSPGQSRRRQLPHP